MVLYGCETWCLTLREENRLNVFENRVEEDIWIRDEVTGSWKKHNELPNVYSLLSIISVLKSRRLGLAGYVAQVAEEECRWESQKKRDH
jgi:hypothetical protein